MNDRRRNETEAERLERIARLHRTEPTEHFAATVAIWDRRLKTAAVPGRIVRVQALGNDFWSRPVVRCVRTGALYVDVNLGSGTPDWYYVYEPDGEPISPIASDIVFESVEGN